MIHYHGTPITPQSAAAAALSAGHAFISFLDARDLSVAAEVCQSFAVDNGAFSAWRRGKPITDWRPFHTWVDDVRLMPGFDFAVIPDVIDGSEADNDALIDEWPWQDAKTRSVGAPVWHMHESLDRLIRLAVAWPRVCIGSSGEFARVGSLEWWARIHEAMAVVCNDAGLPITKLHGLRMLNPAVFSRLPFASADSTNIARNINIDKAWRGTYTPPTKEARAQVMRARIESHNSAATYDFAMDLV